ncbi:MAG: metallophosphoesterase [Thermoplasmatales archaeon]|nr:metallophosphoesterase [Thermoplasmatales archaeon]
MIYPLPNERALYIKKEKAIVIADLHIGIEFEYHMQGINIPIQTSNMLKKIEFLIDENNANKLIIVGDLKHVICGSDAKNNRYFMEKERKETSFFINRLDKIVDLIIVKGNHDVFLRSKRANIYNAGGFKMGNISFAHGHAWPSEEIMSGKNLVFAHVHPVLKIKNNYTYYTKPCWVRGPLNKNLNKYRKWNKKMNFVIMPSFNPLCGGSAINENKIGGIIPKIADIENSYVYLLDGTNLGIVKNLKKFSINIR